MPAGSHRTWRAGSRSTGLRGFAADPARIAGAGEPGGWSGLAYYRWHGSLKIYHSTYAEAGLASLRRCLGQSWAVGVPTWCIFDNTASGAAFGNALGLAASVA